MHFAPPFFIHIMKVTDPPFYLEVSNEKSVFSHASQLQLPILLKGPTGTGKSRFVEHMAHELNRDLITVACHEETSATDLIGRYIIKGTETVWVDGPMTKAVKDGAILYLDEVAEARADIIVAIHSLTDHRRVLYLDKLAQEIKAHENFMLVASYNPGYQRGFKELKPSTKQRFVSLAFSYPEAKFEEKIVQSETQACEQIVGKLVKFANKIRTANELGLSETISTRLLVDAAKLIQHGLSEKEAVKSAVLESLTDDLDTQKALDDLASLFF